MADFSRFLVCKANLTFDDEFPIETSTKDTDIIELFKKFKDDFPSYMPFRADRTNTDKDKEVNDTTKAITKTVVAGREAEFQEMKNKINEKIQELAKVLYFCSLECATYP